MKIVLTDEVDNLGLSGDVVDVADGYARNYLIPRGMAIRATAGAMREAEAMTRSRKVKEAKTLDSSQEMKKILEQRVLRIPARVDESGRLYGSVGASEIHEVLKARGHEVPRKRIEMKGTIKQIGTFEVPVRVHPQVVATVEVEVTDTEGKVLVREGRVRTLEDISIEEQALRAAEELEAMAAQVVDGELVEDPATTGDTADDAPPPEPTDETADTDDGVDADVGVDVTA